MLKNILIVDDDELMCEEISEILRDEGYVVSAATSGFEAIALMHDHHYDLVLLDLKLPGLDGFDILKFMDGKRYGFYVIVVSGLEVAAHVARGGKPSGEKEVEQHRILHVADDILSKPYDTAVLLRTVNKFLQ